MSPIRPHVHNGLTIGSGVSTTRVKCIAQTFSFLQLFCARTDKGIQNISTVFSPNDVDRRSFLGDPGPYQNNISARSQTSPKNHFGEPFHTKHIIERALRKSHCNGATKLKLYSYNTQKQVLGRMSKVFRYGVSGWRRTPNVNLGPPYYLGNYYSQKVEIKNTIRYDQVLVQRILFPQKFDIFIRVEMTHLKQQKILCQDRKITNTTLQYAALEISVYRISNISSEFFVMGSHTIPIFAHQTV